MVQPVRPQPTDRWLSGRKHTFAKGAYLKRVPRVRIPPGPPRPLLNSLGQGSWRSGVGGSPYRSEAQEGLKREADRIGDILRRTQRAKQVWREEPATRAIQRELRDRFLPCERPEHILEWPERSEGNPSRSAGCAPSSGPTNFSPRCELPCFPGRSGSVPLRGPRPGMFKAWSVAR